MPLTVRIDPDIAERVEEEARREGVPPQAVVNNALRARLGLVKTDRPVKAFRVKPHDFGFASGIDLDKMNRLADELEAAAAAQKLGD
jgi:hypothetical protein